MKQPIAAGQGVQHTQFGVGVTVRSDEAKTIIDFHEHGVKTFITSMLEVELLSEPPPRPGARRRKKEA